MRRIEWENEKFRLQMARACRILYEGHGWRHGFGVGGSFSGGSVKYSLRGQQGELIRGSIRGRFASGPAQKMPGDPSDSEDGWTGAFGRWAALEACARLDANPLPELERKASLLYHRPLEVSGDITSPGWDFLRQSSAFDMALRGRQGLEIGTGSAAVVVCLEPDPSRPGYFYPPGLMALGPDEVVAERHPAHPNRPGRVWYLLPDGRVMHWDVRNATDPVWCCYKRQGDAMSGRPPAWEMRGERYPFRWRAEPIFPGCVKSFRDSLDMLPVHVTETQIALDLITDATWYRYVEQLGSFDKVVALASGRVEGFEGMMVDPNVLAVLRASGGEVPPTLQRLPNSMDAVKVGMELLDRRYQRFVSRYDIGLQVSKSESARSGLALMLEMTGANTQFERMATAAEPYDRQAIQGLVSAYNWLCVSGQIELADVDGRVCFWPGAGGAPPSAYIPEGVVELGYSRVLSGPEYDKEHARLTAAAQAGTAYMEDLILLEADKPNDGPDGANWQWARERASNLLAEKRRRAREGLFIENYDIVQAQRFVADTQSDPDEQVVSYTPPADVARTAARGLSLRNEHKRGLPLTAQGNRLRKRSRQLAESEPMTIGQVRSLDVWLETHGAEDAPEGEPGEWGNMSDPSAAYVEWLSQGGDEALAWTSSVLAEVNGGEG